MSDSIRDIVKKINNGFYGNHDFVQTSVCGRGEHHIHGLVGKLWRIKTPESVRVGHCFLKGRLKSGDLFLCIKHSGDCFQKYIYIEEYSNYLKPRPDFNFGSYGIGDAEEVPTSESIIQALISGRNVEKKTRNKQQSSHLF